LIKMEVIAYGATTEEAIENGCKELGLTRDDVMFEVIELPKSKTFGLFGGSPASVRVYVETEDEPEEEIEEEIEELPAQTENHISAADDSEVAEQAQKAADYLLSIISAMGLKNITVEIEPNEDGNGVSLNLKGENLGAVIGRRGETLAALQYLVSLAANNSGDEYFRIAINIGNYREKREGSLENLAKKTALRSLKIGRNLALDPMNPYERRIVHTAVQSVEGATSWSVDEGSKRHVVIGPVGVAEGEDGLPVNHSRSKGGSNYNRGGRRGSGYQQRGGYNNRRGGYNRNYNRDYNRDDSYDSENNGGYSRGYNNDSYNRDSENRGGYSRGYNNRGYNRGGRKDYNGGYNRSSNYSSNSSNEQPREARKDTSAPLYGRIVPKKREENIEE